MLNMELAYNNILWLKDYPKYSICKTATQLPILFKKIPLPATSRNPLYLNRFYSKTNQYTTYIWDKKKLFPIVSISLSLSLSLLLSLSLSLLFSLSPLSHSLLNVLANVKMHTHPHTRTCTHKQEYTRTLFQSTWKKAKQEDGWRMCVARSSSKHKHWRGLVWCSFTEEWICGEWSRHKVWQIVLMNSQQLVVRTLKTTHLSKTFNI